MEKTEWIKPLAVAQQFVANEYVAACWKIKCNVPYGFGFYDNNGNNQWDGSNTDTYIAKGYGCGTYHNGVESDNGPVANAMWQPRKGGGLIPEYNDGPAYPVFMFVTGKGNNDHHFSKVEDAEWETNPNAS